MAMQLSDTSYEAEKALIALIRKESFSRKLIKTLSLSETVAALSMRAIARANSDLNANQIKLLFIHYHYGQALAERVEDYIERQADERK